MPAAPISKGLYDYNLNALQQLKTEQAKFFASVLTITMQALSNLDATFPFSTPEGMHKWLLKSLLMQVTHLKAENYTLFQGY